MPQKKSSNINNHNNSKDYKVSYFRKGIKSYKEHYDKFTNEEYLDEWKRKVTYTSHSHGCQDVLDSKYVPHNSDDIQLFDEKNNFMYDVFNSKLLTSQGKYFVREYEDTRDSQSVWKDYCIFMKSSTREDIMMEDLMTKLTSVRLTSSYKGTSQDFIMEFLDDMRKYESIAPVSDHWTPGMKKIILENSLDGIKAFNDLKTTESIDIAKVRGKILYKDYVPLVQRVALSHDKNRVKKSSKVIRSVYNHSQEEPNNYEIQDDDDY